MSIFVDAGKRFELRLNCNIIKDANGDVICYKFANDGKCEILCDVKGRNFADMSNIIENFFSVIKIKDGENEETYYPDPHNVNQMRYELVKNLSKKWLELTSGK